MTYRVGIVGCGVIAWAHAMGWATTGAEIVGLADPVPGARDRLGDEFSVGAGHRYDDVVALLEAEGPDIVSVCTWASRHAEAVVAAAERGVPLILCEKPMAAALGDARRMMLAAARGGVRFAVGHQRRFFPAWEQARTLIADGAIGEPTHVWSKAMDGLLNNGTHCVDLVRFVLGDPSAVRVIGAVQRSSDRYERGQRIEDSALGMVELAGGVRLFLESDIGRDGPITANAVVHGTDGTVEVVENSVRVMTGKAAGWQQLPVGWDGVPGDRIGPDTPGFDAVRRMSADLGDDHVLAFAQTFADQARSLQRWLDGSDLAQRGEARNGLAALEIVLAIYESVRAREVTTLPLQTRENPLDLLVESDALPVTRPGRYDIRSV